MKYKKFAIILAASGLSLLATNGGAYAEDVSSPSATPPPAKVAVTAAPNGNELEMFRFALEMDKEEYMKKSLKLDAAQGIYFYKITDKQNRVQQGKLIIQ